MLPEELGIFALGLPLILFAIFFAVLGFLVPWFVWRTSVYTRETRDLVKGVNARLVGTNSQLDEANRHLSIMAHASK